MRPTKPFSWSYTALKNFETCQRRHDLVDKKKRYTEDESEQLRWGNAFHNAMGKAIGQGTPLPNTMQHYQSYVDTAKRYAQQAPVATELKLAFTRGFTPCAFFDNAAWFRGVIDVLFRGKRAAVMWDWKTGKIVEDAVQLALFAQMLFCHFEELEEITTSYIWIGNDCLTTEKFTRPDMTSLWLNLMPRVKAMEEAYYSQKYDPNPSGICKKYCPVKECEYYQIGSY